MCPSKCPKIRDWINKLQHIHTMEYYAVAKKNEVILLKTLLRHWGKKSCKTIDKMTLYEK